ncbi:MAG: hypothetical protein WCB77_20600, partial [Pseudolabrys sp.]
RRHGGQQIVQHDQNLAGCQFLNSHHAKLPAAAAPITIASSVFAVFGPDSGALVDAVFNFVPSSPERMILANRPAQPPSLIQTDYSGLIPIA